MIDLALKITLILLFTLIFYQDNSDRMVYWFLYPLVGIFSFVIFLRQTGYEVALSNFAYNITFISLLLAICALYSRIKMKIKLINGSIGLGDILLFIFLSFTFSVVPFLVLFVFSLSFSLILHLLIKKQDKHNGNVPLAGYISLFFAAVYVVSFFISPKYLFT